MRTTQRPIQSKFNASSTAKEIAANYDLTGKIAIVTGGNSGIGYETVEVLAGRGAHVVVAGRDAAKSEGRLAAMKNASFIPLDLADPKSVEAFAARFLSGHNTLHLLINNAGIFRPPEFLKDRRGYEIQFGVNHLGHFQLTGLLWPALKHAGGARVVNLSSIGHRYRGVHLDDLNFEKEPFDKAKAYGQSKTATSLFAVELDRIGEEYGIRAFALHPGAILTDIFRYMTEEERQAWIERVNGRRGPSGPVLKTPQQGAATTVWCALSDQLEGMGGVYCEDCNIAQLVPDEVGIGYGVRSYAVDPGKAAALWQFSESATGVRWP